MTYTTNQGREIGYARVSKTEQNLALRQDALKKRGGICIFTDKQIGTRFDCKGYHRDSPFVAAGERSAMTDHQQDQEPSDAGKSDADILEEQAIEQQVIPFLGDELLAAMTAGGIIYNAYYAKMAQKMITVRFALYS